MSYHYHDCWFCGEPIPLWRTVCRECAEEADHEQEQALLTRMEQDRDDGRGLWDDYDEEEREP